jgi:membrane protease YdiL (CAAX protease family)
MTTVPVAGSPTLSPEPARGGKVSGATWIGLFLSLFGILLIRQIFLFFGPTPATVLSTVWKEVLIWISAAALLVLVRRGERLPWRSIGLGTSPWWKSILWGLVSAAACLAVGGVLVYLTGFGHGPTAAALEKLPLGLVAMIVLRAGVVEELFYRGYAMERLQALGLGRWLAAAIPLVIFGIGHWTGGAANILVALALGAILTVFYLWRRDLVANMIGHWLVDFLTNVLPRLFA